MRSILREQLVELLYTLKLESSGYIFLITMAEVIHEDDVLAGQSSDVVLKQNLSKTMRRRVDSSKKTTTPRLGGQVEVCGTVYKNFMDDEPEAVLESTAELTAVAKKTSQEKRKLVIIMVGLPGRGKTYLCNKLMCYLNWCALEVVNWAHIVLASTCTPCSQLCLYTLPRHLRIVGCKER